MPEKISRDKAYAQVSAIVSNDVWNQLVEKCGYIDLLDRIKVIVPNSIEVNCRQDVDAYLTDKLATNYEVARKDIAEQIRQKRVEQEKQLFLIFTEKIML